MRPAVSIDNVEVFDGTRFIGRRNVGLARGFIVAVSEDDVRADHHVDGTDHTLLPGFIDRHVHIGFFDPADVLRAGITAARDLGWPLRDVLVLAQREGPLLRFAGPMLTTSGGYPSRAPWAPAGTALEVEDAESARRAVRGLVDAGVSVIKIAQEPREGPTLPLAAVRAICDEAHTLDRGVASHVGSLAELEVAIEAGVDELAHGLWSEEHVPDDTITRMVEHEMTVVTTLHIAPNAERIDTVARFAARGGEVVYGTDMGNPPAGPSIDVEELRLMQHAGMSIEAVLAAATSIAAEGIELFDRGTIDEGAVADLILVAGDPRDELATLSKPVLVWKDGAEVP